MISLNTRTYDKEIFEIYFGQQNSSCPYFEGLGRTFGDIIVISITHSKFFGCFETEFTTDSITHLTTGKAIEAHYNELLASKTMKPKKTFQ